MQRVGILCLLTVGLLTGTVLGQGIRPGQHIGWIESEAHPTPGTPPAVIQADIAAGSSYVFVEDATKKAFKANIMPSAANPSPAGQHVQFMGYSTPVGARTEFYVLQVVFDQKALDQRASEAAQVQGEKEAGEKKRADLAAAQKEAAKRTGFGPERTYRGWVINNGTGSSFLEEGTNNIWYAQDVNGSSYYLNRRLSHHVVITAKLYTEFNVTSDGTYSRSHLVVMNVVSEINDNAQPPPGAVRQPDSGWRITGDNQTSPPVSGIRQDAPAVSAQPSDLRDPCSLLTSAEISSVLDRQDMSKGFLYPHEPHTCMWNAQQSNKYPNWIRLRMLSVADFKAVQADLSKLTGSAKEDGIGNDSFSVTNRGNRATGVGWDIGQHSELYVLKGTTAFVLMTGGPTVPSVVPSLVTAARALGLKVAEKL